MKPEGRKEVDGSSISHKSSVLNDRDVAAISHVSPESRPEVKVEPAKVHFSQISTVVHVEEVIDVCRPAEAQNDIFGGELIVLAAEEGSDISGGETSEPVHVKGGKEEKPGGSGLGVECRVVRRLR